MQSSVKKKFIFQRYYPHVYFPSGINVQQHYNPDILQLHINKKEKKEHIHNGNSENTGNLTIKTSDHNNFYFYFLIRTSDYNK